ncbi:hypothetical protein B0H13DRAFT_2481391 [Mycena leptocephala]|nr:hypothetical protein B0H13DRAFT_2481391 [Mycena leptocephala]
MANKGAPATSYQQRQAEEISIHTHFSPSALQIMKYMEKRATSPSFVGIDEGHAKLWPMLQQCLKEGYSRRLRRTGRIDLNGNPELELDYITVTGLHGLRMRISDFYSALGFIVSETDPYPYDGNESPARKQDINFALLAHYTKWVDVLSKSPFLKDSGPTTTCVMYGRTVVPSSEPPFIPAAVFPNLSGAHKDAALKLQQENIQGFIEGLIINGVSPQQLAGFQVHFGHCAEVLALLYMLDPKTASQVFLHGVAAAVAPLRAMLSYDAALFKTRLTGACTNCQYLIRAINEEMGPRSGDVPALRYSDRARAPPKRYQQDIATRLVKELIIRLTSHGVKTAETGDPFRDSNHNNSVLFYMSPSDYVLVLISMASDIYIVVDLVQVFLPTALQ